MSIYPKNVTELMDLFPNEEACLEYLSIIRWPNGCQCGRCESQNVLKLGRGLYRCQACKYDFSVIAGTLFQDTHKPLRLWFHAIWYVVSQKNGVSVLGLQNALGLGSYHTAWEWLHKLRRAMVRPGRDKLNGIVEVNETLIGGNKIYLEDFLKRFWTYYHDLLKYKESPSPKKAKKLDQRFDALFTEKTGYNELDKRIAMTKSRKDSLLLVLQYPELPLHNNASELGARAQARKRDISLHTMSPKGTEAKDTLMTIVETAKKHGVNVYHYFYDRITQKYDMPSLANLIKRAGHPDRSHNHVLPQAA